MFFSYHILIRKNSSFAVIWRYMHGHSIRSKVSRKDLLDVDIGQACTDLCGYIPTGRLEQYEVQNKMSLYLLAQLSYGVTLVLSVQADYLIGDLQALLRSMMHISTEKPRSGKRKTEEDIDEDAEEMEEEEKARKKKRKIARPSTKGPSLLDLSDPRSYVDQQVPIKPIKDQNGLDELQEMNENFMDIVATEPLPPPEWPALIEEERTKEGSGQQKTSVASLHPAPGEEVEDSMLLELERALGVTPMEATMEIPPPIASDDEIVAINGGHAAENSPELPLEGTRDPIYRQTLGQDEEIAILREFDEIKLDSLPELISLGPPKPTNRRRRQAGIIFDEQTQLSDEQMQRQIADCRDIIRSREDIHREWFQRELPTLAELLDPFPSNFLSEQFRPLFQNVLKNLRERPLTFEEAQHITDQGLKIRRFDLDVASWRAETPNGSSSAESAIQTPILQQSLVEQPPVALQTNGHRPEKISVADLAHPSDFENSAQLELETGRRLRESAFSGRPTEISSIVPLEESFQQPPPAPFDQSSGTVEKFRDASFGNDIHLYRESILTKSSPDVAEEGWLDKEMSELYSTILEKQEENQPPFVFFHVAAGVDTFGKGAEGRKKAARKFFTLLKLLKHKKVKVRQQRKYGPIFVRSVNRSEDLDTSMGNSLMGEQ